MMVLQAILGGVSLVLGSLAAATLVCWLVWTGFKVLHHPELGALLCLLILLLVAGGFISSPFLRLTGVYVGLAAIGLWPAGLAWRRSHHFQSN
jgi:hypothetical protein